MTSSGQNATPVLDMFLSREAAELELLERMDVIERFARACAGAGCEDCDGDGMLHEGAEWSLCSCVVEGPIWSATR